MCLPGVGGLPWLPLSVSAGVAGLVSGSKTGASPAELELLLEPLASGLPAASGFAASPGNGKSFFAAGVDVCGVTGASGTCGTPFRLGVDDAGAGVGMIPPFSPGNGNFLAAAGLFPGAGVVPQGSGCGATEHGAEFDAGVVCAAHGIAAQANTSSIDPRCLSSRISSTPV